MPPAKDHLGMPRHAINRVLSLLFVGAIGVPPALTLVVLSSGRAPVVEARQDLAPWPARPASVTDVGGWPTRFLRWFVDHYVARRDLIRLHGRLTLQGLGVSPSQTVLLGRDGWWFYTDDGALDDIVSSEPLGEEALRRWRVALEDNRAWLAARGVPYVFVLTPDKHAVYPEFLPPTVRPLHGSRMDQLTEYVSRTSSVDVLNLRPVLGEAKRSERVFHRTDTHWNDRGVLVAWLRLGGWLARVHPGLPAPSRDDFVLDEVTASGHDLPRMLGLERLVSEVVLEVHPRQPRLSRVVEPLDVDPAVEQARLVTEHPDKTLPRIVIFRDSFMTGLIPFLSEQCSRCVYLWQRDVDPEVIRVESPDIVIHQMVGRRLQTYLPYNAVAEERRAHSGPGVQQR